MMSTPPNRRAFLVTVCLSLCVCLYEMPKGQSISKFNVNASLTKHFLLEALPEPNLAHDGLCQASPQSSRGDRESPDQLSGTGGGRQSHSTSPGAGEWQRLLATMTCTLSLGFRPIVCRAWRLLSVHFIGKCKEFACELAEATTKHGWNFYATLSALRLRAD